MTRANCLHTYCITEQSKGSLPQNSRPTPARCRRGLSSTPGRRLTRATLASEGHLRRYLERLGFRMDIGIVVYSYDGHALSAATKLQAKLVARGHQVTLDRLETVEPLQMGNTTATLRALPAVDGHDALALACPVRGRMPAPPMRVFLEEIPSPADKTIAFLVPGVMPFACGRRQTLEQLRRTCESKGATIVGSGSVWVGPGSDGLPIRHAGRGPHSHGDAAGKQGLPRLARSTWTAGNRERRVHHIARGMGWKARGIVSHRR